jgi:hypothetical protein
MKGLDDLGLIDVPVPFVFNGMKSAFYGIPSR